MSNFNMNKIILGGRVTSDVELRTTPSGVSVTSFTVAVNRRGAVKPGEEQKSDFFSCVAWRNTAEFFVQYFRKGSAVCVIGSIENNNWTDEQGVTHHGNRVTADEIYFVESKSENAGGKSAIVTKPAPSVYANVGAGQFESMGDDDTPF